MDARLSRALLLAALLAVSMGASYPTPNFVIETEDPAKARLYGDTAERLRRDLAVEWVGEEMPRWAEPCRITVRVGRHLGAGGATTFLFDHGEVFGWRMTIQGPHERILDSVLPHEITHMVLASYFRCPLPRWADEGAATSAEHEEEKKRHRKMLIDFLQNERGIPFNYMFAMKEYPRDIMPLYAQGFSLCDYLIQQGGKRKFLAFLHDGLREERWGEAAMRHYGHANLGTLQNSWLAWVAQGSPAIDHPAVIPSETAPPVALASSVRPRPEPNLLFREREDASLATAVYHGPLPHPGAGGGSNGGPTDGRGGGPSAETPRVGSHNGWYASESPVVASATPVARATRAHVGHPTAPQQTRQIILQWERGK